MESLALLVSLILLTVFSGAFVAIGLSFVDHKVARFFVFLLSGLSSAAMIWIAIATGSNGTWVMAMVVTGIGGLSIWNSLRIKRNNEEINRLTSE